MSRIVVVGNGMAGGRVVEELVRRGATDITVLGDETRPSYNRVLLSGVLAGTHDPAAVALRPQGWYAAHQVNLRTGVRVGAIDRRRHRVVTTLGESIVYDQLVLATELRQRVGPLQVECQIAGGSGEWPNGAGRPGRLRRAGSGDCEAGGLARVSGCAQPLGRGRGVRSGSGW